MSSNNVVSPHLTEELLTQAWQLLSPRLTARRRERLEWVAKHRTKHIRLVLQDIHDPHNISACMRSAEAMGIMHVDQVNLYQKFAKPSSVAKGSGPWLKLGRHENLSDYISHLKSAGYLLAAGYPGPQSLSLEELPVDRPVAVIFGNEHLGVHSGWQPHLDLRFTIPMYGMVESFNISVSAALAMYSLSKRARRQLGEDRFFLTDSERLSLLNEWIIRHSRYPLHELSVLHERSTKSPS